MIKEKNHICGFGKNARTAIMHLPIIQCFLLPYLVRHMQGSNMALKHNFHLRLMQLPFILST